MPIIEITADRLHDHIGARAALKAGPSQKGSIPFTVGAVTHHPETRAIVLTAFIPQPDPIVITMTPGTIVQVIR